MGYSHNYGSLLVMEFLTAPNIRGYQTGTLILGTTHILAVVLKATLGSVMGVGICGLCSVFTGWQGSVSG